MVDPGDNCWASAPYQGLAAAVRRMRYGDRHGLSLLEPSTTPRPSATTMKHME